jgi:hypothetical protein
MNAGGGMPQPPSTRDYKKKLGMDVVKIIALVCILKGITWTIEKYSSP